MKANMKAFGNTDPFGARITLKENLNEVKDHSEALLKSMDALIGRIQFEKQQEEAKWEQLRDALLEFRALEVSPWLDGRASEAH